MTSPRPEAPFLADHARQCPACSKVIRHGDEVRWWGDYQEHARHHASGTVPRCPQCLGLVPCGCGEGA